MDVISTAETPAAIGPYAQAVRAGGFVFTAGRIPLDPATMQVMPAGIEEQAERVMTSLASVLAAAGTSLAHAVKTTCILTDLGDFAAFNAVYARHLGAATPARSTVQVARLPLGVLVEVGCVALVDA